MIVELFLAGMVEAQTFAPPKGAYCVQSEFGEANKVIYVVPAQRLNEFIGKAQEKDRRFEVIACPVDWTPSQTQKLCKTFEEMPDDVKLAMTELFAISPDEMCAAAKEVDALKDDRPE